jgi:hypothetical protein
MKKFKIEKVEKSKEERLKEIDKAIDFLRYKRFCIEDNYRHELSSVDREIKSLTEERERINAQDT